MKKAYCSLNMETSKHYSCIYPSIWAFFPSLVFYCISIWWTLSLKWQLLFLYMYIYYLNLKFLKFYFANDHMFTWFQFLLNKFFSLCFFFIVGVCINVDKSKRLPFLYRKCILSQFFSCIFMNHSVSFVVYKYDNKVVDCS